MLAVEGTGDSGGQVFGVLLQVASFAAVGPGDSGAPKFLLCLSCCDLSQGLGLVRRGASSAGGRLGGVEGTGSGSVVLCGGCFAILEINRIWREVEARESALFWSGDAQGAWALLLTGCGLLETGKLPRWPKQRHLGTVAEAMGRDREAWEAERVMLAQSTCHIPARIISGLVMLNG